MKHLFLLKTVLVLLVACSNNDNNDSQSSTQQFFCKINNVDFNPDFKNGVSGSITSTILITGNNSDGKTVQIIVPNTIESGNYTITNNQPNALGIVMQYTQSDNDGDFGLANNAALTIISHNQSTKTIKGTFSFTGTIINDNSLYTISEGTFEIKYL